MAAINNRIILRSLSEENFVFSGNSVVSVEAAENVDVIAGKISIDTAEFTIKYDQGEGEDIRQLPYGTTIWHYVGNELIRKCYVKSIDRLMKNRYKINGISAVGLLDKQYHKGGLYSGESFEDVIEELIENSVPYTMEEDVAETKIFGYLPYATKRDNLHQILFAEGISIIKNSDGDMHFAYLPIPETVPEISGNRIYVGGTINYPEVATKIELIEHSYQFDENAERVTLIDNIGKSPARRKLYVFDNAPIYVNSLKMDGLEVHECGVNYAIVSGNGTLTGIPYYDRTSSVVKTYTSGGEQREISVSDITLVTEINSENVVERLMSYYTSRETVSADLKITGEKCGGVYTFTDSFGSTIRAYLAKIISRATGILKGACEFVSGYEPENFGNNYKEYTEALAPCDIVVPEGTSILKLIIIGGGAGGDSGYGPNNITDNAEFIVDGVPVATPGKGGEPGNPGAPGKIKEIVLHDPEPGNYAVKIGQGGKNGAASSVKNQKNAGEAGTNTTVTTPGGTVYSSGDSDAYTSEKGIMNLFTNRVYAKKGLEGVKGGDGGYGSTGTGSDGEDITYKGKTYKGGKGAEAVSKKFNHIDVVTAFGGAGGEGASAVCDGGSATKATLDYHTDQTSQRGAAIYELIQMNFSHPNKAETFYPEQEADRGCGGDAGCGAPGRGGWSQNGAYLDNYYNVNNKLVYAVAGGANDYSYTEGQSSMPGEKGGKGIVIAYADKPLTIANIKKMDTPIMTIAPDPDIENMMEFKFTNVAIDEVLVLQWQKLTDQNSSEWREEELTITRIPYSCGYQISLFFETGVSYIARVKAKGSEEWEESDWAYRTFSTSEHKLLGAPIKVRPFVATGNKVVPFIGWGIVRGSGSMISHIERKPDGEIQWYKALAIETWKIGRIDDTKEFTAGDTLEYRVYYTYSGWTASDYTDPIEVIIPLLPGDILPPMLLTGEYNSQLTSDPDQDCVTIGFARMDMRSTILCIERKYSDEEEWNLIANYNLGTTLGAEEGLSMQVLGDYEPGKIVQIRAKNVSAEHGDSEYSEEIISIQIPSNKLPKPETFEATMTENGITLDWSAVDNASGYKLKRRLSTETAWTTIQASIAANVTSYNDTNVEQGKTYTYYLIALGDGTNYINADGVYVTETYE